MSKPNGVVLWRGSSLIDGAPIVAIATGLAHGSGNRKTGAMVQTYILREDQSPIDAARNGADASICGDCPHRGTLTRQSDGSLRNVGRTCYVNLGQGPLGVWRAYHRGRYPVADFLPGIGQDRIVRLGTYGDPAAVPAYIWRELTYRAKGHTGYTHQWRKAPGLRGLCMASVDNEADAMAARAAGWRYFRVAMTRDTPIVVGPGAYDLAKSRALESVCPASAEAGKKLTCAQCLACSGANGRRGSIVIQAHGGFAVMANVARKAGAPA